MRKKHKAKLPSIPAPRGFHWHIQQEADTVDIELRDRSNLRIGGIHMYLVQLIPEPVFETHSDLSDMYHGRGWGTKLYAKAIQWCLSHGFKVRSSTSPSKFATRVWKSHGLRELFLVRKVKTVHKDILGRYTTNTWRAYNKPVLGKKKVAARRKAKTSRYSRA